MSNSKPSVFVSSTCYDLRQVREDIRLFLEAIGYEPFLSEFDFFPVDPEKSVVENCFNVIDKHADLFVLLVGGRYGSLSEKGKSVTNLEFLRAKAKDVSTYAFVQKAILEILPVWESNPNGDFSAVVDSPKLFEFVRELIGSGKQWIFPFETAQDVTDTLK